MHSRIFLKGQCQEILLYIEGKIICELIAKWVKKPIQTLRPFANNNPKMYRAKNFQKMLNPFKKFPKTFQKIHEQFPGKLYASRNT